MAKLLDCPFCGGKAEIFKRDVLDHFETYRVECKNCHASSYLYYETEEQAAEAWNRRAEK